MTWTVEQIIFHLMTFEPDSLVFFQDRLGRDPAPHELVGPGRTSVESLDVVIGVLE